MSTQYVKQLKMLIQYVLYVSKITHSMHGKNFSTRHFEIFFLFSPENRLWHFKQVVSLGVNCHENVKVYFSGKNKNRIDKLQLLNYSTLLLNVHFIKFDPSVKIKKKKKHTCAYVRNCLSWIFKSSFFVCLFFFFLWISLI